MNRHRGFSLIDSLVAMAIVMVSVAAYAALTTKSRQALFAYREERMAREVFSHVRQLPAPELDRYGVRFYDFRGLPGKAGDKFRVEVTLDHTPGELTWWCRLNYLDWQGLPRERTFSRTEWRPI